MARFYFHLDECGTVSADPEGRDFVDLAQAKGAAIVDARAIMCAELTGGALCMSCHIDITDATGRHLARVRFKDAVTISGL